MKTPTRRQRRKGGSTRRRYAPPRDASVMRLIPRGPRAHKFRVLGGASVATLTIVIVLMFGVSTVATQYAMRFPQVAAVETQMVAEYDRDVLGVDNSSTKVHFAQNATYEAGAEVAGATVVAPVEVASKPLIWTYPVALPFQTLKYVYYALAAGIIIALGYATRFEFRRHHIPHAAGAGWLIGLMGFLLVIAHYAIFTEPVLALTH